MDVFNRLIPLNPLTETAVCKTVRQSGVRPRLHEPGLKPEILFLKVSKMSAFKWTCAILADCSWKNSFKIPSLQFSFA